MLQEIIRGQTGQRWQTTVFIAACKDATYMNKLFTAGQFSLKRGYGRNCLTALPGCARIYNSAFTPLEMRYA